MRVWTWSHRPSEALSALLMLGYWVTLSGGTGTPYLGASLRAHEGKWEWGKLVREQEGRHPLLS